MRSPRFLPLAGLAWLLGTALQLQREAVASVPVLWGLMVGTAAFLVLLWQLRPRAPRGSRASSPAALGADHEAAPRATLTLPSALMLAALLAITLLAASLTELRAAERLRDRLPAEVDGIDLVLTGVISDLPVRREDGVRLRLQIEDVQGLPADGSATAKVAAAPDAEAEATAGGDLDATLAGDLSWGETDDAAPARKPASPRSALRAGGWPGLPAEVSLSWRRDAGGRAGADMDPHQVRAGERWRLAVRLTRPQGLANPHGFDLELWFFEQGLGASGTVRTRQLAPQRLDQAVGAWWPRQRQAIRDAIEARLGPGPVAGIVAALCVGDQAAISRSDWALFRDSGTAHLVAISGIHLAMLAWMAAAHIRRAWSRWPAAALALPAPHAARLGGAAVALAYAMLAGWGIPAQRTVLMISLTALLPLLGRRWPWPLVLGAVAWAVVLVDPWALLQPGFWLSFVAVALLLLQGDEPQAAAQRPRADGPADGDVAPPSALRRLWQRGLALARAGLHTQALATLGLAPLSLLFFHQLALVGFLANLLAIPLVTLLITPVVLAGVLLPSLWDLAAQGVMLWTAAMAALLDLPGAAWHAPVAPAWAQASGLLAAVVLLLPAPWAWRLLGLPLALPLLWPPLPLPPTGEFELLVADVGQGQAVLVRTHGHVLLYDSGARWGRESDAGDRVLLPLLRSLGVGPLDVLLLSHRDSDHVGGAASLLDGLGARRLVSTLAPDHPLRQRPVPHQPCLAGAGWQWDGVDFRLLHPTPRDLERHEAGHLRPNGVSCVLLVSARGGRRALLLGDVEREQELALLARARVDDHGTALGTDPGPLPALRAEVMLVAHHGSRTSSDPALLAAVAPRWGVIQAGRRNRYGHPAPEVIDRLLMHGIGVVRTDVCGAWHWHSADASSWCQREQGRRYWHAPLRGDGPELAK